jgi:predicted RNA-binding Zn ribbon-like protein
VSIPRTWMVDYGDASLDFVNTRWLRLTAKPIESLGDPEALFDWLQRKEAIDSATSRAWSKRLRRSPRLARQLVREAVILREALYRIFRAVTHRRRLGAEDLKRLNRVLAARHSHPVVATTVPLTVTLAYCLRETGVTAVLTPIALSAAELLTSGNLDRFRRCLNEACGVVFFDRTKNAGRRWCDMARCGSLAKMREYRSRARRARKSQAGRPRRGPDANHLQRGL